MKKIVIFILISILALSLAGCSPGVAQATTPSSGSSQAAGAETTSIAAPSASEALAANSTVNDDAGDYTWDSASVVAISLEGSSISAAGDGVTVEGSKATITAPGTYSLSGTLTNGRIVVNTQSDELVRLILNGVNITSADSAPIFFQKANEVMIVLADGTQNTLSDGASYTYDDAEKEEPKAAIFSNADLTIFGNGALAVTGNFNDGISSDDGIVIAGGSISVTAVDDGIRGKNYVVIKDGALAIDAQANGIKSDEEEDATKGYVSIAGGTLTITSRGDAIQAQTDAIITSGTLNITTSGGTESSAKGIKGAVSVSIDGGSFTIDAADDALHSNGSITINGGTFALASADDGVHADDMLEINGGEITISQSYEGLESAVITINNGTIHVTSSDDGINVAGGMDSSGFGGPQRMGQDTFTSATNQYLYVNGGYVWVDANGDGLDVNGAVEMTGGTVLVNGPTGQNNAALDYDAGFKISGGYLVAVGSAGMAMAPDQNSSQNSILVGFGSSAAAGDLVHIQNATGEDLLTFQATKAFQTIAFSAPQIAQGDTLTIYTGGSSTGIATDGLYQGGSYTAGTQVASVTISGVVTTSGNVGGGPGMGGPRRRP